MGLLLGRRQGRLLARLLAAAEPSLYYGADVGRRSQLLGDAGESSDPCSSSSAPQPCHFNPRLPLPFAAQQQLRAYAINNEPTIRYVPIPEPEHDDFTSEPTTYMQLLSALRNARTLQRLQHLVSNYSNRFDAVHLAAAFARLPRLLQHRTQDLVDRSDVVVIPTPGLRRTRHRHGARIKPTHLEAGAALAAQLDALLPVHAGNFLPRQACCTVWALGELARRGLLPAGYPHPAGHLPDVLLSLTRGNFASLRVHGQGVDYAQLLQGLAKVGYRDEELAGRVVGLLTEPAAPGAPPRLAALQPRELQMVAWALAAMEYGRKEVYDAVADRLLAAGPGSGSGSAADARPDGGKAVTAVRELLPSGIAGLFWAFSRVGVVRRDLLDALADGVVGQELLLAPQDAATIGAACAKLRYANPRLLASLAGATLRQLPTCSDDEAAGVLDALSVLGCHHAALYDAVRDAVLAERAIAAQPTAIVRVMLSYARVGRVAAGRDRELLGRLAAALAVQLRARQDPAAEVAPKEVAAACGVLAGVGYDQQEVLALVAQHAERCLSRYSLTQLATTLDCLHTGGAPYFQLAVAAARQLYHTLLSGGDGKAPLGTIVQLLYCCARQGVEDTEAAAEVVRHVAEAGGVAAAGLGPADAARLLVVVHGMKQGDTGVAKELPGVVVAGVEALDGDTAAAAAEAAEGAGLGALAAALRGRVRAMQGQGVGAGLQRAAKVALAQG